MQKFKKTAYVVQLEKWVMIHQGIHNLPPTENQPKYYLPPVKNKDKNLAAASNERTKALE